MTEDEGKSKVLSDYTIVRLNYLDFEAITNSKEDAMPIPTLLGVLGGNLGLFLGFTVMTFVGMMYDVSRSQYQHLSHSISHPWVDLLS